MVQRRDHNSAYLDLLRGYLMEVIGGAASLPPRRGRPAKPFYNFPVLSSAAPKAAPQHPAPGYQLPFAGGNNFRELGELGRRGNASVKDFFGISNISCKIAFA